MKAGNKLGFISGSVNEHKFTESTASRWIYIG